MAYNIPEILQRRKVQDWLLALIVILLAVSAFGLGRLSALEDTHTSVALCTLTASDNAYDTPSTRSGKKFVASKHGTAYYTKTCAGARRIKEKNMVWFESAAQAEAMGYHPARTCKALQQLHTP